MSFAVRRREFEYLLARQAGVEVVVLVETSGADGSCVPDAFRDRAFGGRRSNRERLLRLRRRFVFGVTSLIGVDRARADADEAHGRAGDRAYGSAGGVDRERHR